MPTICSAWSVPWSPVFLRTWSWGLEVGQSAGKYGTLTHTRYAGAHSLHPWTIFQKIRSYSEEWTKTSGVFFRMTFDKVTQRESLHWCGRPPHLKSTRNVIVSNVFVFFFFWLNWPYNKPKYSSWASNLTSGIFLHHSRLINLHYS